MHALSLPGCGCRLAFQLATLGRLTAAGERFDLVGGASSGSLAGTAYITGRAADGPELFRALMGTKVFSPRWLASDKSLFGMSQIVRRALEAHLPESEVARATTELLVSTTSLKSALGHAFHKRGRAAIHSSRRRRDWHDVLLASCTFPPFYARIPTLDGERHIDGGITDNTLLESLSARGATEITVITPHADGAIYQALFHGFAPPRFPDHVRIRILAPRRRLSLQSFDFDRDRVREALETEFVEVAPKG